MAAESVWSCPVCTYINPPIVAVCEICQTLNPNPTSQGPTGGWPALRATAHAMLCTTLRAMLCPTVASVGMFSPAFFCPYCP